MKDVDSAVITPPQPGDLGWIVEAHGEAYAAEYQWDWRFEAATARAVADFVDRFDPARDRCWIARRSAQRVGSILLTHDEEDPRIARLRLLLVLPEARGEGLGRRLVQECLSLARGAGYRGVRLWTVSALTAARRIYMDSGFEVISTEAFRGFGPPLVAETWYLGL